ncbi:MAG: hypothetical protein FWF77_01175 [Defluviitaleaceae bacterium]|nr:hypothetical protein [Defluviitaleaceae bacterium]
MLAATRSLEAGSGFMKRKKSAPSARWEPGACVGGDAFSRSRKRFHEA